METFFKNMTAEEGSKQKFTKDLMTLIHDAEDLVKATGGDLASKSKDELMTALAKLKTTCRRVESQAIASSRATDHLIREHPLPFLGAALCLGLAIGILSKRR